LGAGAESETGEKDGTMISDFRDQTGIHIGEGF
jgi:hypothetical protein